MWGSNGTARVMGRGANAQRTGSSSPHQWDAVVGHVDRCLKPNANRYRVKARNAPRAALHALQRHGVRLADAIAGETHVALFSPDSTQAPLAVFAVAGEPGSPRLQIRYARLLPDAASPYLPGGPLDSEAVDTEVPRLARRYAESRLGASGLRDVMRERFWAREVSLYTGTALVLATFGFPMTLGVFVVGGVLLLIQGAVRLSVREWRLHRVKHALLRDPTVQDDLREAAARTIFLRVHNINTGTKKPNMLRGTAIVPDVRRTTPLDLLVDEDTRIAAGGLTPTVNASDATPAEPTDLESLAPSDNTLTVVFRRPRKDIQPTDPEADAEPAEAAEAKPDLDDIGKSARVPARVDLEDLGSGPRASDSEASGSTQGEDDIEVIDAELVDPEPDRTTNGRDRQ